MCNLLLLLMPATAAAGPSRGHTCITEQPVHHAEPFRDAGPRCLTAATATALSAQPDAPTESTLARSVRITPDGIDPFDLQQAMERPRSAVSASSLESR